MSQVMAIFSPMSSTFTSSATAPYTTAGASGGGFVRVPSAGLYLSARSAPINCATVEQEFFFRTALFVIPGACPASTEASPTTITLPAPQEAGQRQTIVWDRALANSGDSTLVVTLAYTVATTGKLHTMQLFPKTAVQLVSYQSCDGAATTDATYGTCSGGPFVWAVLNAAPYAFATAPRPFAVT
jgi:hypothetical protein